MRGLRSTIALIVVLAGLGAYIYFVTWKAPEGVDVTEVGRALAAEPGVTEVHDLHVWELTSGFPALSAHVVVGHENDCHDARARLQVVLHDRFGIDHVTLQVEHEQGLLAIEPRH